jgi:hypothetical protein
VLTSTVRVKHAVRYLSEKHQRELIGSGHGGTSVLGKERNNNNDQRMFPEGLDTCTPTLPDILRMFGQAPADNCCISSNHSASTE